MACDRREKEIYWTTSVWFWSAAIMLLILLGTKNAVFTFFAFALGAVGIFVFDSGRVICILFFILPFATIFKIGGGTSFFTYWELLFSFVYFAKKGFKATRSEIGMILFILFLVVNQCLHGRLDITMTVKFFSYFILLAATANCSFEEDNKTLFLCYIIGYIISSFVMLLDGILFRVAPYVNVKLERVNGEYITRFAGLYGDPNYYVVNIIIAMVLVIILLGKRKIGFPHAAALTVPLIVFTAMTGSKSGFLMLAPVSAFFVYQCFTGRHFFIGGLSVSLLIAAGVLILTGEIDLFSKVLSRLASEATGLTSGRADHIWSKYLAYFNENPLRLIFGRSIAFYDLDGIVAHSTYIDLLYEMGVVGTVWLLALIGRSCGPAPRNRRNLLNYSVFLVISAMYFFLSELQYFDIPFHIALAILVFRMDLKSVASAAGANLVRKPGNKMIWQK